MLLIITYSSMVFWLILSVTCNRCCYIFVHILKNFPNFVTLKRYFILLLFHCAPSHRHQTQQQFETKTLQTLRPISTKEAVQSLHQILCKRHKCEKWCERQLLLLSSTFKQGISRHTFILCSALSNPMSMLMMSKPDADLFFWWTPRKSAQRVWEEEQGWIM